MVSKREVRRIFNVVASKRQLPESSMEEFALRAESLLEIFASMCEFQAGGPDSNKRLTTSDVKLAFLKIEDLLTRSPIVEEQAEEQTEELSQEERVERAMMLQNETSWKHRTEKEEEEFGEWNDEME